MTSPLKVRFATIENFQTVVKQGTVVDKFLDAIDARQQQKPSGVGGTFWVSTTMNADFYLILGDDGDTYYKRCSEVKIIPTQPEQ